MNNKILLKVILLIMVCSCQQTTTVENKVSLDTLTVKENNKIDSLPKVTAPIEETKNQPRTITGYYIGTEWGDYAYFKILDTIGEEHSFVVLRGSAVDTAYIYSGDHYVGKKIKIYIDTIIRTLPEAGIAEKFENIYKLEDADFSDLKMQAKFKPKIEFVESDNYKKYTSLQEAIDDAKENSKIIIYPGKYLSDKTIYCYKDRMTIIGVGKPQILCKNKEENVFDISSDEVTVLNIIAKHLKPDFYAEGRGNVFYIEENAYYTTIENCDINGGRVGVYIADKGKLVLKNNYIYNNSLCAIQLDTVKYNNSFVSEDINFVKNRMEQNGKR